MASIRYASQLLPPALYEKCLPYLKCQIVYFNSPRKEKLAIKRVRACVMYGQGVTITVIAKHLGISRETIYRYLRAAGQRPMPVKKQE